MAAERGVLRDQKMSRLQVYNACPVFLDRWEEAAERCHAALNEAGIGNWRDICDCRIEKTTVMGQLGANT